MPKSLYVVNKIYLAYVHSFIRVFIEKSRKKIEKKLNIYNNSIEPHHKNEQTEDYERV